jgi:hypothetical protein
MIGITKKRLYKIKKIKNQSRKIPKRKHKRKRKKKQNKSFRRRRKYNLKNKSLKKYKGGGFFNFDEIMKLKPNALPEIAEIHKAKLARLKDAAKQGKKVIIKQIIPLEGKQDEYAIMDIFFGKDLKLQDDFFTTKTPENLIQKNLKNKLLGLQLRITRKNMATFTKPLYDILNSILLKLALDEKTDGPLYKFFKMPFYKKDRPNNMSEIKKNYPFHDAGDLDSGSKELMKLLNTNDWFKVMFTATKINYSVETMTTASAVPGVIESGLTVLQRTDTPMVNPTAAMVVPPGVASSSKGPTPPAPPQLQADTTDIPQKNDSDTETESDSVDSEETETDNETIIEDLKTAIEIANSVATFTRQEDSIKKYNDKVDAIDNFENDTAIEAWINEKQPEKINSLLTTNQIDNAVDNIKAVAMDNIFQTILAPGNEEYVTTDKDDPMQESLGFNMMSDKEEQKLSHEVDKELGALIGLASNVLTKLPENSTEPLEDPVSGIEEELNRLDARSDARRIRTDSIEMKSEDGEDINWQIKEDGCMDGCKKCVAGVCKDAKKKVGSLGKKMKGKLQGYADAANDPDTGMRARLGKIAPKKYVKLPPPDKPNVYFKATFQNDDWNLKLEKEGFAKDARSWLARVGIMSGGNITEIKSY